MGRKTEKLNGKNDERAALASLRWLLSHLHAVRNYNAVPSLKTNSTTLQSVNSLFLNIKHFCHVLMYKYQ